MQDLINCKINQFMCVCNETEELFTILKNIESIVILVVASYYFNFISSEYFI